MSAFSRALPHTTVQRTTIGSAMPASLPIRRAKNSFKLRIGITSEDLLGDVVFITSAKMQCGKSCTRADHSLCLSSPRLALDTRVEFSMGCQVQTMIPCYPKRTIPQTKSIAAIQSAMRGERLTIQSFSSVGARTFRRESRARHVCTGLKNGRQFQMLVVRKFTTKRIVWKRLIVSSAAFHIGSFKILMDRALEKKATCALALEGRIQCGWKL
mmetsp:Transcript_15375/g.25042  ORF Transcript_15375/g.25042 Transcript_15375/m.25042 type:complete len:213 (+) Transcript_15375:1947-2585(+)